MFLISSSSCCSDQRWTDKMQDVILFGHVSKDIHHDTWKTEYISGFEFTHNRKTCKTLFTSSCSCQKIQTNLQPNYFQSELWVLQCFILPAVNLTRHFISWFCLLSFHDFYTLFIKSNTSSDHKDKKLNLFTINCLIDLSEVICAPCFLFWNHILFLYVNVLCACITNICD